MGRRILITGANGQVGTELKRAFAMDGEVIAIDRKTVDLTSAENLRSHVRAIAPDVILNPAAYTQVDKAEAEPELAWAVNAVAPKVLAEEALRLGATLVHYSTDYVFDGSKQGAWNEEDSTHPLGVYGASKLAGETNIQQVSGKYLIFRTSWVYGPHGKNFFLTMLRLGKERDQLSVVDDQFGAPTSSLAIANATHAILSGVEQGRFGEASEWSGLYHMTCSGSTSWCGFSRSIFARAGKLLNGRMPEVAAIPTMAYPTPAKRPSNSQLSNAKLNTRFDVRLPEWQAELDVVIAALQSAAG